MQKPFGGSLYLNNIYAILITYLLLDYTVVNYVGRVNKKYISYLYRLVHHATPMI